MIPEVWSFGNPSSSCLGNQTLVIVVDALIIIMLVKSFFIFKFVQIDYTQPQRL